MFQFEAVYMNVHTILIATSKEDARRQAVSALQVLPQFANRIAVVQRTADGKVF